MIDILKNGSQPVGPLETKPVGSRIRSSDYRWLIPGTGKVNGELVFGTIWLLFCAVFFGLTFLADGGFGLKGVLILIAFMVPFLGVGLWLFYLGAWKGWAEISVVINRDDFKVTRRLFGRVREKRVPVPQVHAIRLERDPDGESDFAMDLVVAVKGGKDLEVGLKVSQEEKRWLLGQWKEALGLSPARGAQVPEDFAFEEAAIDEGVVELEPGRAANFRLTVRGRFGLWMFFAGSLHVLVGLVFCLTSGIFDDGDSALGIFRLVDEVFSGFGFLVGLVATLGGWFC